MDEAKLTDSTSPVGPRLNQWYTSNGALQPYTLFWSKPVEPSDNIGLQRRAQSLHRPHSRAVTIAVTNTSPNQHQLPLDAPLVTINLTPARHQDSRRYANNLPALGCKTTSRRGSTAEKCQRPSARFTQSHCETRPFRWKHRSGGRLAAPRVAAARRYCVCANRRLLATTGAGLTSATTTMLLSPPPWTAAPQITYYRRKYSGGKKDLPSANRRAEDV